MNTIFGSETFGTQEIKTDEYLLLAKCMVTPQRPFVALAAAKISFIDDCLAAKRLTDMMVNGKSVNKTKAGHARKRFTWRDMIDRRLDALVDEIETLNPDYFEKDS